MKKLNLIFTTLILLVSMSTFAQIGNFNYQAAVRNASGDIMQNESVTVDFAVLSGSASGPELFAETHTTTTNEQGLINLEIGAGTATNRSLGNINWATQDHFLQVSIDGTVIGASKFNSVPYSNSAESALNADFATNSGTAVNANQAINSTYADTATFGVNDFRVDSILTIGHNNGQQNDLKTTTDGKLQIMPNGGSFPSVTFEDDGLRGVGIGTENPTEKLEVNGAIKVVQESTMPQANTIYGNSLPIAYGFLSGNGNIIYHQYGISSYTKTSTGTYEIVLSNTFVGNAIVIANSSQGSPRMVDGFASGTSNTITIRTYDPSGTLIDTQFNFTVFGNIQ